MAAVTLAAAFAPFRTHARKPAKSVMKPSATIGDSRARSVPARATAAHRTVDASSARHDQSLARSLSSRGRASVACRASGKKKGFIDELLDVMEGGPKLRKWYGQDSSVGAPNVDKVEREPTEEAAAKSKGDEGGKVDTEEELLEWDKQPRRATLVAGADTQLGEAVVMQLIVAKQPVTALGISPEAAAARYGPYVTAAPGADVDDAQAMANIIRKGVRAVIYAGGKTGALPQAFAADGKVKHVVLVSATGASKGESSGGLFAAFGGDDARRRDPAREAAFKSAAVGAKVPLTIVRPGTVKAAFGGKPLVFSQGDNGPGGEVSLEDAAEVCVRCLGAPPAAGSVIEFEVCNGSGVAEGKRDWKGLFGGLSSN
eukprot:CAMPEP_0181364060 /NCGR_PEP_ID=MMETSP1106-20121128/9145_1 /TAXON_ID=81844 /ORGANISM="Mantoniella antarctica, Strain SL-175" /LENGTH=371 /DNA_ID=CAMNT_0023478669 /DNA_START=68 /DNA_END=1183 /DNA_ORIENTATION=-